MVERAMMACVCVMVERAMMAWAMMACVCDTQAIIALSTIRAEG